MMHPKSLTLLDDIAEAAAFIVTHTASVSFVDYRSDRLLRSAVERNFEIIGEALLRLEHLDRSTAGRIKDHGKIIGFRNRLVHGYDAIDQTVVWTVIESSLPLLDAEVNSIRRDSQPRTDQGTG
jgi:uncharacterized protein with HEPN domain